MRSRNVFQAYYTRSTQIVDYMIDRLEVYDGSSVLDPCAGDGVFVDAVLATGRNVQVTAYEVNAQDAAKLARKYGNSDKVSIRCGDALVETTGGLFSDTHAYDRIIANPPYGAWQDPNRRRSLKILFPGLYVRETYGLFLFRCIDLLSPDGRLVFIIPDTFLSLHLHEKLRSHLLSRTVVEEIVLFPSKFFPGVSFGYANLSIITLRRALETQVVRSNKMRVIRQLRRPSDLCAIADGQLLPQHLETASLRQEDVFNNPSHAFLIAPNRSVSIHLGQSSMTIGEIAVVVTGFYSGNDQKYLRRAGDRVRGRKKYQVVNAEEIAFNYLEAPSLLNGLEGPRHFVPIVKGGATRYVKPNDWFMDWSTEAILDYRVYNKERARFQNSSFYFRDGIGVPMVSSSYFSAALLESRLFDQSIVAIFPRDPNLLLYLLGFFNSSVCNELIRTINPSANNSANYIKKIPFVPANRDQQVIIDSLVLRIVDAIRYTSKYDEGDEKQMNDIFADIYRPSTSLLAAV